MARESRHYKRRKEIIDEEASQIELIKKNIENHERKIEGLEIDDTAEEINKWYEMLT